jgi:hypothetical protein
MASGGSIDLPSSFDNCPFEESARFSPSEDDSGSLSPPCVEKVATQVERDTPK